MVAVDNCYGEFTEPMEPGQVRLHSKILVYWVQCSAGSGVLGAKLSLLALSSAVWTMLTVAALQTGTLRSNSSSPQPRPAPPATLSGRSCQQRYMCYQVLI